MVSCLITYIFNIFLNKNKALIFLAGITRWCSITSELSRKLGIDYDGDEASTKLLPFPKIENTMPKKSTSTLISKNIKIEKDSAPFKDLLFKTNALKEPSTVILPQSSPIGRTLSKPVPSTIVGSSIERDKENLSFTALESQTSAQVQNPSKWTSTEIRSMLSSYRSRKTLFSTCKTADVWLSINKEMQEEGHTRFTTTQIKDKMHNMKRQYNKKKDSMGPKATGGPPVMCPFFEELDEIFRRDHNVTPVGTASNGDACDISFGRNTASSNLDLSSSEEYTYEPPRKKKRNMSLPQQQREDFLTEWRSANKEFKGIMKQMVDLKKQEIEERQKAREAYERIMERRLP